MSLFYVILLALKLLSKGIKPKQTEKGKSNKQQP